MLNHPCPSGIIPLHCLSNGVAPYGTQFADRLLRIFAVMVLREISRLFSLVVSLSVLGIRAILASRNELGSVPSASFFSGRDFGVLI